MAINFPPANFPTLNSDNLILRELRSDDAQDVFRIFADDEVTRYYDFDTFSDIEQALQLITRQRIRFEKGKAIRWGITLKADDSVIGTCGIGLSKADHGWGGLGYELNQSFWRQGIMTEALQVVTKYGFQSVGLNRIQALVMPGNRPSMELLLKIGFIDEGLLREHAYFKGSYQDLFCFSLLFSDWSRSK